MSVDRERLRRELESFQGLWRGGYAEADLRDPLTWSNLGPFSYVSVMWAIAQACIRAYVRPETVALEIGPGQGAWTECMLGAREVWVVDALSADHNGFWSRIGDQPHVTYLQAQDFSLDGVPDGKCTYVFSYGTFCHISPAGVREYLTNLRSKLASGAECFVMIADYAKYRQFAAERDERWHVSRATPGGRRGRLVREAWRAVKDDGYRTPPPDSDEDDVPRPGRWYDTGLARSCCLLEELGYEIVTRDVGLNPRDPIIHFRSR